MTRRLPAIVALAASLAILVAACGGGTTGPALTDPTAIVTAALKSTEAAKSVHLDVTVDGKATVTLPGSGGSGTTVDLTGTTATADVDFANKATKVTFKVPKLLGLHRRADRGRRQGLYEDLVDRAAVHGPVGRERPDRPGRRERDDRQPRRPAAQQRHHAGQGRRHRVRRRAVLLGHDRADRRRPGPRRRPARSPRSRSTSRAPSSRSRSSSRRTCRTTSPR